MPFALLAALVSSLAIHAAALFLPDVDLSTAPELPPLQAEIQIPPRVEEKAIETIKIPVVKPARVKKTVIARPALPLVDSEPTVPVSSGTSSEPQATSPPAVEKAAESQLPAKGGIRFKVYRGDQGLEVGRASHEWEFNDDGSYRLRIVTETSGLAALFKPIRIEMESRGKFVAGGLQPDRFSTFRNGAETNENADFDWTAKQLTLTRDGKRYDLVEGAQDIVSFHYQLIFVPQLVTDGATIGVANGKKFERYRFQSMGEEILDTPAGAFRTLHVRVQTDSTTELWLALERQLLPIKIRHTDRKGESFEQIAVDLGNPP